MPPALPPAPLGLRLGAASTPRLNLEVFLDLCCPFSKKLWTTLRQLLEAEPGLGATVHQVPQPWHPQSAMMHECALAAALAAPGATVGVWDALFAQQVEFFDDASWAKSRAEIYAELAAVAGSGGADEAAVAALLAPSASGGNSGNGTTAALKLCVKHHRKRGVHVTPTVSVNGLEADAVSSSWTVAQWREFLGAGGWM